MAHVLDGREHPLGNRLVNVPGIIMLEFAPSHALSQGRGRENLVHFPAGHVFKLFGFQLFLVQGADEHQIGELLDHRQGIGDASRPDVRPDFVHIIFNRTGYHAFRPPFDVEEWPSCLSFLLYYTGYYQKRQTEITTSSPDTAAPSPPPFPGFPPQYPGRFSPSSPRLCPRPAAPACRGFCRCRPPWWHARRSRWCSR